MICACLSLQLAGPPEMKLGLWISVQRRLLLLGKQKAVLHQLQPPEYCLVQHPDLHQMIAARYSLRGLTQGLQGLTQGHQMLVAHLLQNRLCRTDQYLQLPGRQHMPGWHKRAPLSRRPTSHPTRCRLLHCSQIAKLLLHMPDLMSLMRQLICSPQSMVVTAQA